MLLRLLPNHHLIHQIPLPNLVNYLQAFIHFSKNRMIPVEVRGIVARMADEKLGAAGVAACMGHGEDAAIVVLVLAGEFAINFVAGAAGTRTIRTTSLDDKIGNDAVKFQAVVEAFFR